MTARFAMPRDLGLMVKGAWTDVRSFSRPWDPRRIRCDDDEDEMRRC